MKPTRLTLALCGVLLSVALTAGCQKDDPVTPPGGGGNVTGVMPDFSLADVNPTSATLNQPVSPRDYLAQVSAWYFGHAT